MNRSVLYYLLVPDFIFMFHSHKKKRAKQIKKLMQRGLMDPEKADPFSLFLETSDITYCLYRDSERVLGNTFGMCILQVSPQDEVFTCNWDCRPGLLVAESSFVAAALGLRGADAQPSRTDH